MVQFISKAPAKILRPFTLYYLSTLYVVMFNAAEIDGHRGFEEETDTARARGKSQHWPPFLSRT